MSEERTERCETCRFWKPPPDPKPDEQFSPDYPSQCRRYPPKLSSESLRFYVLSICGSDDRDRQSEEATEASNEPHVYFFPVTTASDWCGEYESKPGEES